MGGLRRKMPITFLTMLIATLSISGVPFVFSGFWSKDAILGGVLERAMGWDSVHYYILFIIALGAAGITAFYMFRLIFMTFFGKPRNREMYDHAHESPGVMAVPLIILAVLSFPIVNTWSSNPWSFDKYVKAPKQPHVHAPSHASDERPVLYALAGASNAYADDEDTGHGEHGAAHGEHAADDHHAHSPAHKIAMVLSIIVAGCGILLSYLFYHLRVFSAEGVASRLRPLYNLFWNKYYFDEFYNGVIVAFFVAWAGALKVFDLRVIDGIVNLVGFVTRAVVAAFTGWFDNKFVDGLVNWVAQITWLFGGRVRRLQTGAIQNYLLVVLGGVVLLILIFRRFL